MRGSDDINPPSIATGGSVQLLLFGGVRLRRGDRAVTGPVAQRHRLALLALLAGAPGHALSRDKLTGYLWPESAEHTARNRLTTCVHNIRSALGNEVLESAGAERRLDPAMVTCDAVRFEAALAVAEPAEAIALYSGPFLDGFHLPGSTEFDLWSDRERERHHRAYRTALETVASAAEARGDYPEAVRRWEEAAASDPADSRTVLRLMAALEVAGSAAAALRAAQTHVELLRDEYLTTPPPELFARLARLRSGATAPQPAPEQRRIAVLPFEPIGDEAMPGFTDGMHGDLLNRLSSIGGVAVISRTSVVRFRATALSLAAVAQELGADWIVQGEVRSAADEVRVDARLVDARHDRQVWGKAYRSKLTAGDVFDVQARITSEIAQALETQLSVSEERAVAKHPTADLDSHLLYVQGRGHLDERTDAGPRRSSRSGSGKHSRSSTSGTSSPTCSARCEPMLGTPPSSRASMPCGTRARSN